MESATSTYPTQAHTQAQLPHSGMGIAAFVISILLTIGVFVLLGVAGYMETSSPGGLDENSIEAVVLGLFVIASGVALLIGAGLGLAGVLQRERRRVFAILGLVINGGVLALLGVVLAIGLATG